MFSVCAAQAATSTSPSNTTLEQPETIRENFIKTSRSVGSGGSAFGQGISGGLSEKRHPWAGVQPDRSQRG
jgi:hypothetical protein